MHLQVVIVISLRLLEFFNVFFFKQKTAYEMRISDWSSDVCSSDLDDPALGLVILAELDPSGNACDDRVVLGLARLEQLGHPRQTAGDVAGLGGFPRNTRDHVACFHPLPLVAREDGVPRTQLDWKSVV